MGQISQGAIEFATRAKVLDGFGITTSEIWERRQRRNLLTQNEMNSMQFNSRMTRDFRRLMEGDFGREMEGPLYDQADLYLIADPTIYGFKAIDNRVRVSAAQIHAELYAEVDTLLAEPEGFSEQAPTPSGRVDTLLKMGFLNQPDVSDFMLEDGRYQGRKLEYDVRRQWYDLARRYAFRYPNYKFITHGSLDKVLGKYGLVNKGVNDFVGTIPDANVADMARFMEQVTIAEEDRVNGDTDNYFIAAPIDQFRNKSYMGFASKEAYDRWLIEDPIVLKQVRDGFLIVTAWGDEASDPDVQNERNN